MGAYSLLFYQMSKKSFIETTYPDIIATIKTISPAKYGKSRNYLSGSVTHLSPYITRGIISVRTVYDILREQYSDKELEPLVFQLLWREYFYYQWQQLGDSIWHDIKHPQPRGEYLDMPSSVLAAETGITVIDEAIRGLYTTGYMHNHARMWVASIVCNTARTRWKLPSRWLYYHLLDGDIASNSLSWQWVAGTFSTKIYLANQDNINKYSRTEQHGTFLDDTYDALALMTDVPSVLASREGLALTVHLPVGDDIHIDPALPTYLYHAWHLDPMWRSDVPANRICIIEPSHVTAYPVSELVMQSIETFARHIPGMQIFVGERAALDTRDTITYTRAHLNISHWPDIGEAPPQIFESPQGTYSSYFSFWNAYLKWRKKQ